MRAKTLRPDDLVQAANYLNTEFAGLPLLEVREAVLARLQQERTLYDQLLTRALRLARVDARGAAEAAGLSRRRRRLAARWDRRPNRCRSPRCARCSR